MKNLSRPQTIHTDITSSNWTSNIPNQNNVMHERNIMKTTSEVKFVAMATVECGKVLSIYVLYDTQNPVAFNHRLYGKNKIS